MNGKAPRYAVDCWYEGGWWNARVPSLSAITSARTRKKLPDMAEDLIATVTDREPDSFYVDLRWLDAPPLT